MRLYEQIAWNTFKKTGDINIFLELKEIENLKKSLNGEIDEFNKNEGDSINRE